MGRPLRHHCQCLAAGLGGNRHDGRFFQLAKVLSGGQTRIPAGRWGKPEDFGALAIYLMSAASAYHTGDTIRVDGGYCVF
ncbi:MAG: SDR family oxidoreductase [Candidatus Competibacteraceae bacterium]